MLRWLEIISRIDFGNGDTQTVSLACSKPTCQLELQISLPVPLGAVRVTAFQSGNLREALCIGALADCTAQCKSSAEAEPLFTHWGKTEFGCMYILHNTKTPASLLNINMQSIHLVHPCKCKSLLLCSKSKHKHAKLKQQRQQISTKDDGTLQSGSNFKHLKHANNS